MHGDKAHGAGMQPAHRDHLQKRQDCEGLRVNAQTRPAQHPSQNERNDERRSKRNHQADKVKPASAGNSQNLAVGPGGIKRYGLGHGATVPGALFRPLPPELMDRRSWGHPTQEATRLPARAGRPPSEYGSGGPGTRKKPALFRTGFFSKFPGGDLLSHPVAQAVPSAVRGLTAGFGMGPGVSPPYGHRKGIQLSERLLPRKLIASANIKSSPRTISTGQLNALRHLHIPPIYAVVCCGPYRIIP